MGKLHSIQFNVGNCTKEISVHCDNVTMFEHPIDVLITSAFAGGYEPTPNTLFFSLDAVGIDVRALSYSPEFDLRNPCHVWLSKEIPLNQTKIKRIACVELLGRHMSTTTKAEKEQSMLNSIRSCFHMLDIASIYGIKMTSVALPLLGSGSQNISHKLMLIPLINECISFLKRNHEVKNIYFIEKSMEKSNLIAEALEQSDIFSTKASEKGKRKDFAFISYSTKDKNIADNLCSKLESNGIKVWYAPRNITGIYSSAITKAINEAAYFIVILSQNSLCSYNVLSEVNSAFNNLPKGIKCKPIRIDNAIFDESFTYYLNILHWFDATNPPLEERLNEFVESILNDSQEMN